MIDLTNPGDDNHYDLNELTRAVQIAAPWLIPEVFPNGRLDGRGWRLADIAGRAPRNRGSCEIEMYGPAAAVWFDYGLGHGGSPFDTLAHGWNIPIGPNLYARIGDRLGIRQRANGRAGGADSGAAGASKLNEHAKPAINVSAPWAAAAAQSAVPIRRSEMHRTDATFEWGRAVLPHGTLAEVYLAARGLTLPVDIGDLRFGEEATDERAKLGRPAVLLLCRDPASGKPSGGIHRTFLKADGSWHIGPNAKRHLGPAGIWMPGGLAAIAAMQGTLGIAEGLEKALACAEMFPDAPVWAALGAGNLRKLALPPGLRRLIVYADRGLDGQGAATHLRDRAFAAGIEAEIRYPERAGEDWDEWLSRIKTGRLSDNAEVISETDARLPATASQTPQAYVSEPQPLRTSDEILAAAEIIQTAEQVPGILTAMITARLTALQESQILTLLKRQLRIPGRDQSLEKDLRAIRRNLTGSGRNRWLRLLQLDDTGQPRLIMGNAVVVLREDEAWRGVVGFDKFANHIVLLRAPPWIEDKAKFVERSWTDADTRKATEWMQMVAGVFVGSLAVFEAVTAVSEANQFHPVQNYLCRLHDDKKPRLDDMLIRYFGALEDAPENKEDFAIWQRQHAYLQAIGARFMISAVARIFEPGCKADCVLTLIGSQGTLKSTALKVLFEPWFSDDLGDIGSKDAAMQIAGVWCVEIAELAAMRRVEIEKIKAFISRTSDHFRPPYGRVIVDHLRSCVFAGTTNRDEYLADDTGARRFWSVKCGRIDIAALRADRDRLWAEAVRRYRAGESWWLYEDDMIDIAAEVQENQQLDDPWQSRIAEILRLHPINNGIDVSDILDQLGIIERERDTLHVKRAIACLRRCGWRRRQTRTGIDWHKREWRYFPEQGRAEAPQ